MSLNYFVLLYFSAVCWVSGQSHFYTFDTQSYTVNTNCEYTLAKDMVSDVFDISIKNVPCGSTGTTCANAFTIRIGNVTLHLVRGRHAKIGNTLISANVYETSGVMIRNSGSTFVQIYAADYGISLMYDQGE